ncbi:MAG: hypothetical protein M3145_03700 [Pseudomonadota bacterium]|nr:hypothetical protein [Pseudomonadota bacterium]
MDEPSAIDLLRVDLKVVNIGLESFAEELAAAGVPVVQVEWTPPAGGDPELADLLSRLGT